MSSLFEKVKEQRIEYLYNKYPQHKKWFEDVLVPILVERGYYTCYTYKYEKGHKEWNKGMPIYDDNVGFDLDDIVELLCLEGFSAKIYQSVELGVYSGSYKELIIEFKSVK